MLKRTPTLRGFTVAELLLVMALIGLAALLSINVVRSTLRRAKLEGVAREVTVAFRAARFQAVKRGFPAGIRVDEATGDEPARMYTFLDQDLDGLYTPPASPDPGDLVFTTSFLPQGVSLGGPANGSADDALGIFGFPTDTEGGWILFDPDGAARNTGAFRIGDEFDNFFEIRLQTAATGQIALRKWILDAGGSGGEWQTSEDAEGWTWY